MIRQSDDEDEKKKKKKKQEELLWEQILFEAMQKSLETAMKKALDNIFKDFE